MRAGRRADAMDARWTTMRAEVEARERWRMIIVDGSSREVRAGIVARARDGGWCTVAWLQTLETW